MDLAVTRVDWNVWNLADLLGRPVGRITKHVGHRFVFEADERMRSTMLKVGSGPYASLDEALIEIEKQTSLAAQAHFGLAALYRKQGQAAKAQVEMEEFRKLQKLTPQQN